MDARCPRDLGRMASGDFRTWPCGSRGTGAPCSGKCPAPWQSRGSNGELFSSRISLSLDPPLAMCLRYLRRVTADDDTTFGWVSSISSFFYMLILAVTTASASHPCPTATPAMIGSPTNSTVLILTNDADVGFTLVLVQEESLDSRPRTRHRAGCSCAGTSYRRGGSGDLAPVLNRGAGFKSAPY